MQARFYPNCFYVSYPRGDHVSVSRATEPLEYASSTTPRRRRWWFHIWLLPLLWLPGAIASTKYVGDEFGSLFFANLPAVLVVIAFRDHAERIFDAMGNWFAPVFALPFVILLGFCLDRLRASWRIYLFAPLIFAWAAVSGVFVSGNIPPLPASAMPARRWDPDSLCVAYCWTFYLLALAAMLLVPLVRLAFRRVRFSAPVIQSGEK
jgi:hypothetical protein